MMVWLTSCGLNRWFAGVAMMLSRISSSLREVEVFRHILRKKRKVRPKAGTTKGTKVHDGTKSMKCKRTRKSAKELIFALSFVDLRGLRGYRFSKIPAAPMPPPTHIVTIP